mgnify:CR=1 FL=1
MTDFLEKNNGCIGKGLLIATDNVNVAIKDIKNTESCIQVISTARGVIDILLKELVKDGTVDKLLEQYGLK